MKNIIYIVLYVLIAIPSIFLILINFLDIVYPPFVTLKSGEIDGTTGTNNAIIALIVSITLSVALLIILKKWFKK